MSYIIDMPVSDWSKISASEITKMVNAQAQWEKDIKPVKQKNKIPIDEKTKVNMTIIVPMNYV